MKKHAIILGGGFAGMLAAKILSKHYQRISMIEPKQGLARIPQGVHLHVLLKHGQNILATILPELFEDIAKSCPLIDWGQDSQWTGPFGNYPRYRSGLESYLVSRPYLDTLMQHHTKNIPNVEYILDNASVAFANGKAVGAVANKYGVLLSDLVVDARGRSSDLSQSLKEVGCFHEIHRVESELSYSTRIFQRKNNPNEICQHYVQVRPGYRERGIVISPVEDNKIVVTLVYNQVRPPFTEQEFTNALKEFSLVTMNVDQGKPLSPVSVFCNFAGKRLVINKKQWPKGLIAIGDAYCIMNPVYGQGMTLAAREAQMIDEYINKPNWECRFQKAIEKETLFPWLMARADSEINSPVLMQRIFSNYINWVMKNAQYDPVIHKNFIRSMHMVGHPLALVSPQIILRSLKQSLPRIGLLKQMKAVTRENITG